MLRIRRIRFKPGYSRIWRKERTNLRQLWQLKLNYQRSLTRFLTHFKSFTPKISCALFLMRLEFIIRCSLFLMHASTVLSVIEKGLIFVNGVVNLNKHFVLYPGDLLQFPISLRYYANYARSLNSYNLFAFRNRIHQNKFHAKHRRKFNYRRNFYIRHDIFNFLEVDFLTMSSVVLFWPNDSRSRSYPLPYSNQLGIVNIYNWKYIT